MNILNHPPKYKQHSLETNSNQFIARQFSYQHPSRPQIHPSQTQIQNNIYSVASSTCQPFLQEIEDNHLKQSKHKIELCRAYSENGFCQYGSQCIFAHGVDQLYQNHPSIRVRFCKNFYEKGYCRYGKRCNFRHDKSSKIELPKRNVDMRQAKEYLQREKNKTLSSKLGQDKLKNQSGKSKLAILRKKLQSENERALKKLRLRQTFFEFPQIVVAGFESSQKFRHLVEFEYRSQIDSEDCITNKFSEYTDIPSD